MALAQYQKVHPFIWYIRLLYGAYLIGQERLARPLHVKSGCGFAERYAGPWTVWFLQWFTGSWFEMWCSWSVLLCMQRTRWCGTAEMGRPCSLPPVPVAWRQVRAWGPWGRPVAAAGTPGHPASRTHPSPAFSWPAPSPASCWSAAPVLFPHPVPKSK